MSSSSLRRANRESLSLEDPNVLQVFLHLTLNDVPAIIDITCVNCASAHVSMHARTWAKVTTKRLAGWLGIHHV